jgi:hypothetical protein
VIIAQQGMVSRVVYLVRWTAPLIVLCEQQGGRWRVVGEDVDDVGSCAWLGHDGVERI